MNTNPMRDAPVAIYYLGSVAFSMVLPLNQQPIEFPVAAGIYTSV